jgi:hypothetical protein
MDENLGTGFIIKDKALVEGFSVVAFASKADEPGGPNEPGGVAT